MKKIFILFGVAMLASSCMTLRQPTSLSATVIDYTKYAANGIFVTEANSVSFDYKPIGSIVSLFASGFERVENENYTEPKKSKWDYDVGYQQPKTTNKFVPATAEAAVDELIKKATDAGANAVMNLKVTHLPATDAIGLYDSYQASGMAIRR